MCLHVCVLNKYVFYENLYSPEMVAIKKERNENLTKLTKNT